MGSPSGIWTAVSGGMAQSENVDIIANNLANVNTVGFKEDVPEFKEYLTAAERPISPEIDIPRTAFKDSDFYHFDGVEHAMVHIDKVHTIFKQGDLHETNAPFDMAVNGPGFFTVQTPQGLRFTRAGNFKVNSNGLLVTVDGYPVMGLAGAAETQREAVAASAAAGPAAAGQPVGTKVANPFITPATPPPAGTALLKTISLRAALASHQRFQVASDGLMYVGKQPIGYLAMAEFSNPDLLRKTNLSFYANPNPANVPKIANRSIVRQGYLEQSNVNAVGELMKLLKANRMFESNMRAMKAYNDMAGKEANEVGKL